MTRPPLLEMRGISKAFGGVPALDGVDFTLGAGEAVALVGENGAGKSTLIKVMTGAHRADAGQMRLEGRPVAFNSPTEALAAGVAAVYQEVSLLPSRTVAENLLLGREPTRWGLVDWLALNARAAEVLRRVGLDVPPDVELWRLGPATRQLVAIARGISLGGRALILDEPTSSLTNAEAEALFACLRRLTAEGVGVVYVSHRMDELYRVCSRVTVLRDGRHVADRPLGGLPRLELVRLMLGREREGPAADEAPRAPTEGEPLFRAEGLRRGTRPDGLDLEARPGEVVGLAGLLGSGRTESLRLLFGLDAPDAGRLTLDGRPFAPSSPSEAIGAGLGLLTEDRKADGIVPEMSVADNLTLAALPLLSRLGIVSPAAVRAAVERFMGRLRIKGSPDQPVRELSGGNQQKVLLARWLCRPTRLLLLDEPTRGVDVGAQAEIRHLIDELAREGLAVLLASSDLDEVVQACTRVVVLRDGKAVASLSGPEVAQGPILKAMAGGGA